MKIRPAQPDDAPAIAHVITDIFNAVKPENLSEEVFQLHKQTWYQGSERRWRETIEKISRGESPLACVYVAEDEAGEVVGMAYACPSKDDAAAEDVGELDMLYVNARDQRQGIGRALVQVTAAHMARVGMNTLQLCTPTTSTHARRFYDKLGGRIVGTRDDDEDGEVIELVVYEWKAIHTLVNLNTSNTNLTENTHHADNPNTNVG